MNVSIELNPVEITLAEIKALSEQTDILLVERNNHIDCINCLKQSGDTPLATEMFLFLLPGRIKGEEKKLGFVQETIDFNLAYSDTLSRRAEDEMCAMYEDLIKQAILII